MPSLVHLPNALGVPDAPLLLPKGLHAGFQDPGAGDIALRVHRRMLLQETDGEESTGGYAWDVRAESAHASLALFDAAQRPVFSLQTLHRMEQDPPTVLMDTSALELRAPFGGVFLSPGTPLIAQSDVGEDAPPRLVVDDRGVGIRVRKPAHDLHIHGSFFATEAHVESLEATGTLHCANVVVAGGGGVRGDAVTFLAGYGPWEALRQTNAGATSFHAAPGAGPIRFQWGDQPSRFEFQENGEVFVRGPVMTTSDRSQKQHVQHIRDAMDRIRQLAGYTFVIDDRPSTGVIAQEVEAVLPEAVHRQSNGLLSVAYAHLVGLLIEGIKDLDRRLSRFEAINP